MLAPVFMTQGDLNRDGRLSRDEFGRLAQKWFHAWDTNGAGKLEERQIRAGLDQIRNPAGGGIAGMLLGPEGGRNGIASAFGIRFEYVRADLEFEGRWLRNVGVRYKGNGTFLESRDTLKRSLKINLNAFVSGQGLGNVKMLNLQNNITDATEMNEVLAYRLYREAGVPAPRTAYARVFVTVPDRFERKYLGLYSISEAVDKQFARHNFGTGRGALFKPVTPSLFTDLGSDWSAYNQIYDPKGDLYDEQKQTVMKFSQLVTQADDAEFAARVGEFIDLPRFARFMAVMVYLSDLDGILGPGQNMFLYLHPKTQQFEFIPWDQDHSWGQFDRASQEQREQLSLQHPWQGANYFLERMFKLEAFQNLYLARLNEFSRTIFNPDRFARQVDELAETIRPAIQEESAAKLDRFDQLVAGLVWEREGAPPFGGGRVKPIKPFTRARTESVLEQLSGKSNGLEPGNSFSRATGGSGLGRTFGPSLFRVLDENNDASVSRTEFISGFARLFQMWDTNNHGNLTFVPLRAGIAKDLVPSGSGFSPFGGGAGAPQRRNSPAAAVITGTKDPGLFMSEHWGMSAFSCKLPNGQYLAKLYFSETYAGITGPGQRVFSLNVQGREFKDFDIWAKAGGPNRAYVETTAVNVTNGEFRVAFTRQIENPAINAIELIPQTEAGALAPSSAETIRIIAGRSTPFTDSDGQVWEPDRGFEGGGMSQLPGNNSRENQVPGPNRPGPVPDNSALNQ